MTPLRYPSRRGSDATEVPPPRPVRWSGGTRTAAVWRGAGLTLPAITCRWTCHRYSEAWQSHNGGFTARQFDSGLTNTRPRADNRTPNRGSRHLHRPPAGYRTVRSELLAGEHALYGAHSADDRLLQRRREHTRLRDPRQRRDARREPENRAGVYSRDTEVIGYAASPERRRVGGPATARVA